MLAARRRIGAARGVSRSSPALLRTRPVSVWVRLSTPGRGSVARLQLLDADIAEHHQARLIVKLQPDRPGLRPPGLAGVFGNYDIVQLDADHPVAGLDIEAVPVVVDLVSGLGGVEEVDAAR